VSEEVWIQPSRGAGRADDAINSTVIGPSGAGDAWTSVGEPGVSPGAEPDVAPDVEPDDDPGVDPTVEPGEAPGAKGDPATGWAGGAWSGPEAAISSWGCFASGPIFSRPQPVVATATVTSRAEIRLRLIIVHPLIIGLYLMDAQTDR